MEDAKETFLNPSIWKVTPLFIDKPGILIQKKFKIYYHSEL